jgi:hypothetical protein
MTIIKNKNIFQKYITVILIILTIIGIAIWVYVIVNKFGQVVYTINFTVTKITKI